MEATCVFKTGGWSIGTHQITVTVSNEFGSKIIRYTVHVLSRPGGIPVKTIYPGQTTDPKENEAVELEDLQVKANVGLGFLFSKSNAETIDFNEKRLQWDEKLKSNFEGLLQFGRKSSDQHFLLRNGVALLATTDSGKRLVILQKGILRSRNIGKDPAKWTVMIGSWLQIDTDADGDVIAELNSDIPDSVSITVLRGNARVMHISDSQAKTGTDVGSEIPMSQGMNLVISKINYLVSPLKTPKSGPIAQIIAETTPEFLFSGSIDHDANPEWLGGVSDNALTGDEVKGSFPQESLPATKIRANSLIAARDFFTALTVLQPFEQESTDDLELAMLLGIASKGIFLYEQATLFFDAAIFVSPKSPNAYFEIGEMMLNDGIWTDAADYFELANSRNFTKPQLLHYYRGVAEFNAGQRIPAYQHFRLALWSNTNSVISSSSQEFISKIRSDSVLDLRFGIGSFYDSNIFRLAVDEKLPHPLTKKADHGYSATFGLSLIVYEVGRGSLFFTYDVERSVFNALELVQIGLTSQTITTNFAVKVGGDSPKDAIYEIGLKPYAQMFSLGDRRSMNSVGADFYFLFSNLWSQPSIHYESAARRDPFPGRDDILDPILWEVTTPKDRSNRYGAMALYMQPIYNELWTLDLGLKSGVTSYTNAAVQTDSNTDADYRIALEFRLNVRNHLSTAINFHTRNFYDADDERYDKVLRNEAAWRFFYTPNFTHKLSLNHENGASTRGDAKYSRSTGNFGVELAF
jgi:tetratricopeptide (TPR) repeat protein